MLQVKLGSVVALSILAPSHVMCLRLAAETTEGVLESTREESMSACVDTYASQLDAIDAFLGDDIRARRIKVSAEPRASKVIFGAGFGTTATRSLNSALQILGLKGEHWGPTGHYLAGILGRFDTKPRGDATCKNKLTETFSGKWNYSQDYLLDTPSAELFLDIFALYPDAKFILTNRESNSWVKSRLERQGGKQLAPRQEPCGDKMWDYSNYKLSQMFEYHSELVRCLVPRDNLLEFNVWDDPPEKMKHLMADLAQFVGKGPLTAKFPGSKLTSVRLTGMHNPSEDCHFQEDVIREFMMVSKNMVSERYENITGMYAIPSSITGLEAIPLSAIGLLIQEAARKDCELAFVVHKEEP